VAAERRKHCPVVARGDEIVLRVPIGRGHGHGERADDGHGER
jgi:hypothetical protein